MHVVIAGCGRVGSQLAESLSRENHDVVVIDKNQESFERLGGAFHGPCIEGIAFDQDVLLEAGVETARVFAAVTNADKTNLMAALVAKRLFHVPVVLSRLYDLALERTFSDLDIDHVCGTEIVAEKIVELLFQVDGLRVLHENKDMHLKVVESVVPPEAEGLPVSELSNGATLKLIALARDNREIAVDEGTRLAPGDSVVLVSLEDGWLTGCRLLEIDKEKLVRPKDELPDGVRIVVGGCSQVGSLLATHLAASGFRVSVIDDKPEKFRRLRGVQSVDCFQGLIYEENTLADAGIEEAAGFTAVGKLDNENLMAAEVAKHVFDVPKVVARLFNPDKESTYRALDTTYVCGTGILSRAILSGILRPSVRVRSSCTHIDRDLVEFVSPMKWLGKTIGSLSVRTGLIFSYITRGTSSCLPDDEMVLKEHDVIGALATPEISRKLEKLKLSSRKWLPST